VKGLELKNHKSFVALMNEIDAKKHEQRDRGTLFELLVAAYLENDQCMLVCLIKSGS
jgi:predicted helicase